MVLVPLFQGSKFSVMNCPQAEVIIEHIVQFFLPCVCKFGISGAISGKNDNSYEDVLDKVLAAIQKQNQLHHVNWFPQVEFMVTYY